MIESKINNEKLGENEVVLTVINCSASDFVDATNAKRLEWKWICIVLALLCFGLYAVLHIVLTTPEFKTAFVKSTIDAETHTFDMDSEYKNDPIKIVSRSMWNAQPPAHELTKLELPISIVIVAHTATENCSTQASCAHRVKVMQNFHMDTRDWDDIGYNFLVGGDGAVYVGRDWDNQGAHTKGHNRKSICIAFIGTFNKIAPPQRQLNAARRLIQDGIRLKKLAPDYKLYGQRQLIPTESPGQSLYESIQKWDHWS